MFLCIFLNAPPNIDDIKAPDVLFGINEQKPKANITPTKQNIKIRINESTLHPFPS
jgi:hypothetical protein